MIPGKMKGSAQTHSQTHTQTHPANHCRRLSDTFVGLSLDCKIPAAETPWKELRVSGVSAQTGPSSVSLHLNVLLRES